MSGINGGGRPKGSRNKLGEKTPYRGVEVVEVSKVASKKVNWNQIGSESNIESCKNADTTTNDRNSNENNKPESSISEPKTNGHDKVKRLFGKIQDAIDHVDPEPKAEGWV